MAELPEISLNKFRIADLSGTRCRLQRLSDLRFYSGWINWAEDAELEVDFQESMPAVGDKFQCEAAYEKALARFMCRCKSFENGLAHLIVEGEPEFGTPGQEPRFRVTEMGVSVYGAEEPVDGDIVDVSLSGIGILTYSQLPRFTNVRLIIEGSIAQIECRGTVRYCRPNPRLKGSFRVGITLEFDDRLTRAMWNRLVVTAGNQADRAA